MSINPYKAPTADLDVAKQELIVPQEIAKKIKNGWVAGLVSVVITTIFILISLAGTSIAGMSAWAPFDFALMSGLSYGVFKKSRTCAVLLLAFFALNKALILVGAGSATSVGLALVFLWFFYQGVVGTFQFHRWKRDTALPAG
jgi:serine/threonine-protein kinase